MCFIQKDDGNIIHDSNLITHEVKTFYENLYASHENNIIHCNTDNIIINTPTLSQEESDKKHCHLLSKWKMTKVLVLMALQLSFFNSFSQTWVHLWFTLLTMGSTVAKCQSHKDKGYKIHIGILHRCTCIPKGEKWFFGGKTGDLSLCWILCTKLHLHVLLLDLRLFCQSWSVMNRRFFWKADI